MTFRKSVAGFMLVLCMCALLVSPALAANVQPYKFHSTSDRNVCQAVFTSGNAAAATFASDRSKQQFIADMRDYCDRTGRNLDWSMIEAQAKKYTSAQQVKHLKQIGKRPVTMTFTGQPYRIYKVDNNEITVQFLHGYSADELFGDSRQVSKLNSCIIAFDRTHGVKLTPAQIKKQSRLNAKPESRMSFYVEGNNGIILVYGGQVNQ